MQTKLLEFPVKEGGLLCRDKGVYSTQWLVLQSVSVHKPLREIMASLRLSKQALNRHLVKLLRRGWIARLGFGVYVLTKDGKKTIQTTGLNSGSSKPPNPRGGRRGELAWVSAHHDLTFRFALRGRNFDRGLFCKRRDGKFYWYLRDGVTARLGASHVFFTIYGCSASSVRGVFAKGLARARWAAGYFERVTGARVSCEGEAVGLPHFVVVDKALAKWLRDGLNLSRVPREVAGCKWYLDESHKGLVEFVGSKPAVECVGDEVAWLLAGGARSLLEEIKGLRGDLQYKPGVVGFRREVL